MTETVSSMILASHLDCSRAYIGKAEGVIQRQGDGFPLDHSRVAYLRFLRREHRRSPRTEADADHVKAKTELLQIKIEEKKSILVRRDAADELIDQIAGTVLTHLSGMTARCSRDLAVRRNIDAVVDQVRREIAAACLAKADEINEPPLDKQD
ncbi:hypothetical protein [Bradyrhizobium sp. Ec3.3]|uniref:hypothetical protein n=1 Tax=Bradyrhizobium sp. Ec3.3 TaxID=189753 RepID=UPI000482E23B|nr:hypothetical protein [Bradyrhizobium sp. Ec3.3]